MRPLLAKLCLLATGLWMAVSALAHPNDTNALRLGIMPYFSTRTLITTYQPLADMLEQTLQQPVRLITAPDYVTFLERASHGEYDLMIIGPHFAFALEKSFGFKPILIHKARIQSLLISLKTLPIEQIKQLKGHTLAVADIHSMMALQAKHLLEKQGMIAGRHYELLEAQNQPNALQLVLSGKARAALLFPAALKLTTTEEKNKISIYSDFPSLPGLIYLVSQSTPATKIQQIQHTLLNFESTPEGQVFLGKTGHEGFRLVTNEDRQSLRGFMPMLQPLMQTLKP